MREDSAVSQVVRLAPGETFTRSYVVATPYEVKEARRLIHNYLSKLVSRAKQQVDRRFHIHTISGITYTCDIMVSGAIVAEEEDDSI